MKPTVLWRCISRLANKSSRMSRETLFGLPIDPFSQFRICHSELGLGCWRVSSGRRWFAIMSRTCKATLRLLGSNTATGTRVQAKQSRKVALQVRDIPGGEEGGRGRHPSPSSPVVRRKTRARTATGCVEIEPQTSQIRGCEQCTHRREKFFVSHHI